MAMKFKFTHFVLLFLSQKGWPAFHQSTVHASPLLYDIDKDGGREIVLATFNGVVNFFRSVALFSDGNVSFF